MDDVGAFVTTFKEFPPRSFPPSFVPANIMEETLDDIKENRAKAGERAKSIDKIRSGVNQMIEQQLQNRPSIIGRALRRPAAMPAGVSYYKRRICATYFVTMRLVGVTVLVGAASEIENVSQVFQPDGRLSASNSRYPFRPRNAWLSPIGKI